MSLGAKKSLAFVLLLLIVLVAISGLALAQDEGETLTHVVVPGETLFGIAARYGVSAQSIIEANGIANPDIIRVGSRLIIPLEAQQVVRVHIVRRGETLLGIANRYGVTLEDINRANDLINPNYVYAGQRLYIPVVEPDQEAIPEAEETPVAEETITPTLVTTPALEILPAPEVTTTPEAPSMPLPAAALAAQPGVCLSGCEVISISSPTQGMTVTNPIAVTGLGVATEQVLVVRVLDGAGYEVGLSYVLLAGAAGQPSLYTGTVTYTVPAATQPGRIQVYSLSPVDGAIEHLTSVVVTLQGAGLDGAVENLKVALESQDYEALQKLLTDPWILAFYRSDGLMLDSAGALEQLRTNYLGPGDVFVDLSVNAAALLKERVELAPIVEYVVFSTGWGPDGKDDAFLLFVLDEEEQTRWGGMIYVFDALRDYRKTAIPAN